MTRFALDFVRVPKSCLNRLVAAIPEYRDVLLSKCLAPGCRKEPFTAAGQMVIERYSPPLDYVIEWFNELKQHAAGMDCTASVCSSSSLAGFNDEAGARGHLCMGINIAKVRANR